MLIFFEGLDGCGKSTVMDRTGAWLTDHGRLIAKFRDPGGTPLAEEIRRIVKSARSALTPATRFLLFSAARVELMKPIEQALQEGKYVLVDRWWFSTYAYQCADGVPQDIVLDTVRNFTNLPYAPELAFYFAADADERARRKERRGDTVAVKAGGEPVVHADHYDNREDSYTRAVEKRYEELADSGLLTRINANRRLDAVCENVRTRIMDYVERTVPEPDPRRPRRLVQIRRDQGAPLIEHVFV